MVALYCECWTGIIFPEELTTPETCGSITAVVELEFEAAIGVISIPTTILPLFGAVNRDGSILNGTVET
jgi:hypothetical protein